MINFENYFKESIIGKGIKFTIVLGSGFHKQAYENRGDFNNALTCWCCLLKELKPNVELSKNYILDFETIVIKDTNGQDIDNAKKIEKLLLIEIKKILLEQQEKSLLLKAKHPLGIFNSSFVSDVISLNFDIIPELLINKNKNSKIEFIKNSKGKVYQSTRHREINGIKYWHPHGDIKYIDSIILGARKYGNQIRNVEQLRNNYKNKNSKNKTWYDALTDNPILILGASISDNEWDIWSAFVNRERNFGKNINSENNSRKPIFQMREGKATSHDNSNEIWFQSLFEGDFSYNEQWKKLEELLK